MFSSYYANPDFFNFYKDKQIADEKEMLINKLIKENKKLRDLIQNNRRYRKRINK
jgi:hypothetical protein